MKPMNKSVFIASSMNPKRTNPVADRGNHRQTMSFARRCQNWRLPGRHSRVPADRAALGRARMQAGQAGFPLISDELEVESGGLAQGYPRGFGGHGCIPRGWFLMARLFWRGKNEVFMSFVGCGLGVGVVASVLFIKKLFILQDVCYYFSNAGQISMNSNSICHFYSSGTLAECWIPTRTYHPESSHAGAGNLRAADPASGHALDEGLFPQGRRPVGALAPEPF